MVVTTKRAVFFGVLLALLLGLYCLVIRIAVEDHVHPDGEPLDLRRVRCAEDSGSGSVSRW